MCDDNKPVVVHEPVKVPRALQIMIAVMCAGLIFLWGLLGALAGFQAPLTIFGFRFEGGYKPEPAFYSTLTNIVISILSAALGLATGYKMTPQSREK